jgi:PTS system mannose-specific IIA component
MSTPGTRTIEPMVGVVVVSHEQVAFSLIEAARRVVGRTIPNIAAACVSAGEDSASILHKVAHACSQVDDGAGVVLLVDVYGSTPFNVAMTMADGTRSAEVVCGVNLPMLLKVATLDRCGLSPSVLAYEVQECGKRSIRIGAELTGKVTPGGKI